MHWKYCRLCWLAVCCLLLTGCPNKPKDNPVQKPSVAPPAFDVDSAYQFVKAQTDFGPRVMGSEAHAKCAQYLLLKLSEFCDTAFVQEFTACTYDGKRWPAQNIIGSFAPEKRERVVLSSHWDSRPFADHDRNQTNRDKAIDGANDGASGVGVLLEVARQLQKLNPAIGVDIVLFDAEDYGPKEGEDAPPGEWWGLGSQYWAQHLHKPDYMARYGILLDMVGTPNAQFYQESFSVRDAQPVVAKVWGHAYDLGFGNYFINQPGGIITDDHYYVNKYAPFKMIDIIHYDMTSGSGFDPVWHTVNDNIQHIDKNTLGVVGQTLLYVIKNEK
ncbi:MAG: M28 family peptidase [Bacteroidales bacterium]|nr:M28 family peptidase [Bacteroidales bacterium]